MYAKLSHFYTMNTIEFIYSLKILKFDYKSHDIYAKEKTISYTLY